MSLSLKLLKTTLIGGLVFLLPLIVVLAVLGHAMALMSEIAAPLAARFPDREFAGVAVATLVALGLVLALCFAAGLLARAALGRALSERFEDRLNAVYPRYTIIKTLAQGLTGQADAASPKIVLVTFDDHQLLAMEVERLADGRVVLFQPGAPDPWSGSVVLVAAERVETVNAKIADLNRSMKGLGRGSAALLGRASAPQ